jgi:TetR/AcrR family transcriptional regulator, cholesterol catabolism regulator
MNDEVNNILDRVSLLYNKYGIKSITMDDVSRELGISKKTLYQYVEDKHELVQKSMQLNFEKHQCEFDNIFCCDKNAIEELIEMHRLVNLMMKEYNPSTEYDLRKYYPDLFRQISEQRRNRMYENVLSNLKKGKAQGIYRKELNEVVVSKLTISRIFHMLDNETVTLTEFTSPEFFAEVIIYHIRGIANEKGLKTLQENYHKLNVTIKEE